MDDIKIDDFIEEVETLRFDFTLLKEKMTEIIDHFGRYYNEMKELRQHYGKLYNAMEKKVKALEEAINVKAS